MISFIVYGNPVAQGRPRFARRGKHITTYDPEKSRTYKDKVYTAAVEHRPPELLDCPLSVQIMAYIQIPKSWSKKRQEAARSGIELPVSKLDVDNLAKGIMDSLTGIIWRDDGQVVNLTVRKRYSDTPRVEVEIREAKC